MNKKFIKLLEKINEETSSASPRIIQIRRDKIVQGFYIDEFIEEFDQLKLIWFINNNFYNLQSNMFIAKYISKISGYKWY